MQLLIILFNLFIFFYSPNESIYSRTALSITGDTIRLSDFQGRKILFVNIATGSEFVEQLAALQNLQVQHQESLVIVGFPSNSFGNEFRSNSDIFGFCQQQYNVQFLIASISDVSGNEINPIYAWLTKYELNGEFDSAVMSDFQKYLVNESGQLVGVFSGRTQPGSANLLAAINQNYNN